jgi:hypothetical protein
MKRLAVFPMLSIMKKLLCIATLLLAAAFWISNPQMRDWIKFRVYYRDYLTWKREGGPVRPHFYEPLMLDRNRDGMVRNLSPEQAIAKYPFLVDGDEFPADSYKGEYLRAARKENPRIKILWFKKEDGFDLCVEIDDAGAVIRLIKG